MTRPRSLEPLAPRARRHQETMDRVPVPQLPVAIRLTSRKLSRPRKTRDLVLELSPAPLKPQEMMGQGQVFSLQLLRDPHREPPSVISPPNKDDNPATEIAIIHNYYWLTIIKKPSLPQNSWCDQCLQKVSAHIGLSLIKNQNLESKFKVNNLF
ncbi:unnamed protein product [Allacma fusca]|uniref:Uncharacterized protein n=1 Tax=Allacma fusca TaxID=39272 RepID=A0A8J2PK54_9HEXA|nr:unnamed protein product [Allacma fusca]